MPLLLLSNLCPSVKNWPGRGRDPCLEKCRFANRMASLWLLQMHRCYNVGMADSFTNGSA